MKFALLLIAFITGAFMLADGITVMVRGRYIGPPTPGPWSYLFTAIGVNPFSLGPLFIVYGLAWLLFLYAIITGDQWGLRYGVLLSVLTLWYLPVGTLFSIIAIIILYKAGKIIF